MEGRPPVPPEQLLSALLIQVLYGIRSERQLMEQLNYNLLYRWFIGLSPDDAVWDPTTFTKNRERLQAGEVFETLSGRGADCSAPPPRIPACGFPAPGSCRRSHAAQRQGREALHPEPVGSPLR
jgi:hypothetical protein